MTGVCCCFVHHFALYMFSRLKPKKGLQTCVNNQVLVSMLVIEDTIERFDTPCIS